jgi:hypothetical protein
VSTPDAGQLQHPAHGGHELPQDPGEGVRTPRPDEARPRGNPQVEQMDLDRGVGKLERVSGH